MSSCRETTTRLLVALAASMGSLAVCQSAAAQQEIMRHVDGDAGDLPPPAGSADGLTWATAYRFLQDAITAAEGLVDQSFIVEIWVAATDPGNPYRPDQNAQFGGGDETATFSLHDDIRLYGGFLGLDNPNFPGTGETELEDRDPEANITVLNGVLGFEFTPPCGDPGAGDCGVDNGTPGCSDPACCQAVCGVLPECCLTAWDQDCADLANAAVVCEHCGDPGAADCFGMPNGTAGCSGASCCAIVCSDPAYEYCCTDEWDLSCMLQAFYECKPQAHHVVTAIGVDDSARLDGFTVTGGYADGGGLHGNDGAGALLVDASPVIVRCMFRDNNAPLGGGAGIEVTGTGAPTVIACSFTRNSAIEGQGMRLGGGAAEPLELVNCSFFVQPYNYAGGSGIFADGGDLDIKNCTFAFNDTFGGPGSGGQIKIANGSQVTISNSIVWGMVHGPHVVVGPASSVTGRYSNVQSGLAFAGVRVEEGGTADWDNTNIGEDLALHDPRFVDGAGFSDLRLGQLCSRCIDRADTNAVPPDDFDVDNDGDFGELTPDRNMMDRLRDGLQDGFPAIVDMGAHEFVPPIICLGDCEEDPDGAVGINDLLVLLAQWNLACTSCDWGLGGPGVGVNELLAVLAHWGEVCPGSGAPSPPSLEEELADACLIMADWDQHAATMTDPNSTQEEKDNSDCWMRHYINDCDNCSCDPPASCPGPDPFN